MRDLRALLPNAIEEGKVIRYVEPFVGGGALLFSIASRHKIEEYAINDKNRDLVSLYRIIKGHPEELIKRVNSIGEYYKTLSERERKEYYYRSRNRFNSLRRTAGGRKSIEAASIMMFLNKTCYNGLFRLNENGDFNVPFGRHANPQICDKGSILRASKLLQSASISGYDFRIFLKKLYPIGPESLVYVDPPYVIQNGHNGFLGYNDRAFSWKDQIELATRARQLAEAGAYVIVSNAKHRDIASLYPAPIFRTHVVNRKSLIGGRHSKRREISEYVFTTYDDRESMKEED